MFSYLVTLGVVKLHKTILIEIVFWAKLFCPLRDHFQRFYFSWTRIFTAKRFLSVELRPIVWRLILGRDGLESLVVLLGLIYVAISSERRFEYFHDWRF